jgi:O-antigen/teichoic acid export membrane protein
VHRKLAEHSIVHPDGTTRVLAASRTRRLLDGALSTMLSKSAVLLVSAISIPITVRYLGPENFGVWVTISTALSMLLVLDLGVANALTNFISEAYARDDRDHASTYTTTALGVMLAISLLIAGIAWWIWPSLHWDRLFHLSSAAEAPTVGRAVAAALAIFLVGLPAGLAPKILGGYQELRAANLFIAAGSLLNLLSIIVLVHLQAGLVALVTASSAALVGANLLALVWIFFFHKPWLAPRLKHVQRRAARRMMQSGSEFFVLQVAGLIAFNSDNLVVAHYLGPAQVATYSVAWRLVGYAAIAQTLVAPSLWPAFSEAFARGDLLWIRQTFRHTMALTMGIALAASLLFALAGRWIIRIWASRAAVPTEELLLLMCVWVLISTFMNNTATILVAKGETRSLAIVGLIAAAANLALSIYWVQRIGAPGVILATIVSYLILLVGPQTWKVYQVLKENASTHTGSLKPEC